ncbi:MAG: two-component system chemotaxis response regulator CheB [Marinoscillum sp.]
MTTKIKILVVDDSAFIRLLISDLLSKDEEMEVVGTAVDGKEAVAKTLELNPDVILMDMIMGEYGGQYAVKEIMEKSPRPILILSSLGNTNLNLIFDALALGAVDYINKPKKGGSKIRQINAELLARVKKVARAKPRPTNIIRKGVNQLDHTFDTNPNYEIIVIGASTGGPTALEKVITSLPANLNVPVVIVQHMPPNFIHSFATRLDALTALTVEVGQRGSRPRPGHVLIAPGDSNMILIKDEEGIVVDFTKEVFKEYNNPSINAMMLSIAKCYGPKAIGVVLTGMGKDGVIGLKEIKESGGKTIAQDEATSIIYGMPKLAFDTGAADVVLSIKEIGGYLVNCL